VTLEIKLRSYIVISAAVDVSFAFRKRFTAERRVAVRKRVTHEQVVPFTHLSEPIMVAKYSTQDYDVKVITVNIKK